VAGNCYDQLLAAAFALSHSHKILWLEPENSLTKKAAATDKTPMRLIRCIMFVNAHDKP
jgi:hypothetical protein